MLDVDHPSVVNGVPWGYLQNEMYRVCTFLKYDNGSAKSGIQLANHGFAYVGSGEPGDDAVICVFCLLRHQGWRQKDEITDVHRRLSPSCPSFSRADCKTLTVPTNNFGAHEAFQTTDDQLSKTDSDSDYSGSCSSSDTDQSDGETSMDETDGHPGSEPNTLTSFLESETFQGQSNASSRVSSLSQQAGAHSILPQTAAAATNQCRGQSPNSSPAATSPSQHGQQNNTAALTQPTQPVASNQSQTTYEKLGVFTDRPKRPEYRERHTREQSFNGWPSSHPMVVEDLVNAGFYYAGYSDTCRCFNCGGGLRNWEETDNVYVEHARWFPKCGFLKRTLGQEFIDAVQRLSESQEDISYQDVLDILKFDPLQGSVGDVIFNDPAVRAVIDEGVDKNDVYKAATALVNEKDLPLEVETILNKLESAGKWQRKSKAKEALSHEEEAKINDDLTRLREQNRAIRQQATCKVCYGKPISILFLPCRHLASCIDCSQSFQNCPICRDDIKGIVKVSFS